MQASLPPPSSRQHALQRWAIWVVASSVGLLLALAIPSLIMLAVAGTYVVPPGARALIFILLPGIGLGIAQWFPLRSLPGFRPWPILTALTFPFLAFSFIFSTLTLGNVIDTGTSKDVAWAALQLAPLALVVSLSAVPMAGVQFLLLSGPFRRAGWWIPATVAGWMFALTTAYLLIFLAAQARPERFAFTDAVLGVVLGSIQAVVTGALLISLKPRASTQSPGA